MRRQASGGRRRRILTPGALTPETCEMKVTVTVELKPSVLDPQGKAIQHSLSSLGFAGVEDVRAGKLFRITLADSGQSRPELEQQLRQMCEKLLANTVIENFSYTLEGS
jgi:phosphoribosylformylglycinamidine synthase subunit PurS